MTGAICHRYHAHEPKGARMLMPVHRRSLFVTIVLLLDFVFLDLAETAKLEISA